MPTPDPPIVLLAADAGETVPDVPGWRVRAGFLLPSTPWDLAAKRWVCHGTVADEATAQEALAAVARGVGIVAGVALPAAARSRFLEDVHRLRPDVAGDRADTGAAAADADAQPDDLSPDEVALLEALAAGESLTSAAARLHLSRRTANRRLAVLRARLGVTTTAEVVTRWSTTR